MICALALRMGRLPDEIATISSRDLITMIELIDEAQSE